MAGLTRRELLKHRHGRPRAAVPAPSPPERLHSVSVTSAMVTIAWRRSHDHGPRVHYEVLRNGRRLARVRASRFEDRGVSAGTAYRYAVRTIEGDRDSRLSRVLLVTTPALVSAAIANPPAAPPAPPPTPPPTLTQAMVDRLTFYWHRHFAVSKDAGIDSPSLLAYRDRLRRYADFATTPTARFSDLALEMTTQDSAMSQYLTGFQNVKYAPNENYGREFMELFTLGVTDANGNPNYSQTDVHNLARAFTGYQLDFSKTPPVVKFTPGLADTGTKTILGQTAKFNAPGAVALVLSQPNHAPFLVRGLWNEFIAAPIPGDALAALTSAYLQSGTQLQPVIRGILSHPLMFDSLDEPAMIKSPVVYTVGVLRATGAPLEAVQTNALADMLQQPYHPPNVAGWPGGLAWMTTGTSVARFSLIPECQGVMAALTDVAGETPDQAYARAYAACGSPWLSATTQAVLRALAISAPSTRASQRLERQYALRSLMLGGPDGQVM